MRVLIANNSDSTGGAARAAYRLHSELRKIGLDSQMLVQDKKTDDPTVTNHATGLTKLLVKGCAWAQCLPLLSYPHRDKVWWDVNWLSNRIAQRIKGLLPDLVHLHWIGDGFLSIENIARINAPIVWTLHDMWAFTGGCHYDKDCGRYHESCGTCPQLKSNRLKDASRWVWKRKDKAWRDVALTIVTPSRWLAKCALASSLLRNRRIEVIPNGLDLNRFRMIEKSIARDILGLPKDKHLILFGAMDSTSDTRKGFHHLQSALQHLAKDGWANRAQCVIFGSSQPAQPVDLGLPANYLGCFYDEVSLALIYSAADVFVAPSTQDNLPNTVMEASACATPSVAFNIGGLADLIEHEHTGYLARPFETDDLAHGLSWLLSDGQRLRFCGKQAREKVEGEFEASFIARRHQALYEELLS